MEKSLIVVESLNDKAFIELLLKAGGQSAPAKPIEIASLHKFDGESRGKSAFPKWLTYYVGGEFQKRPIGHLAIILDADDDRKDAKTGGLENSIRFVNQSIKDLLGVDPGITTEAQVVPCKLDQKSPPLNISCFFFKTENKEGDLDQLLRQIANKEVPYCSCLVDALLPCLEQKNLSTNDFDKIWINKYTRAAASREQRRDAERKLHEVILEKGESIFDLNHPILNDLKSYLKNL